jgi:hypothetical protein
LALNAIYYFALKGHVMHNFMGRVFILVAMLTASKVVLGDPLIFPDTAIPSTPRTFGVPFDTPSSTTVRPFQLRSLPASGLYPQVLDLSPYRPTVVASGNMIQTKGIFPGRGYLYIADTGKDEKHNEPGRIWRFDPLSSNLTLFFESVDLINPKWLYYYTGATKEEDRVIISDYGEESTPRQRGTGRGAKVIAIPVRSDGVAGSPAILHAGPPLFNPEGVTVIGRTVILSDWAAGPLTTRPEVPNDPYHAGAVFAIPMDGGPVTQLFPDHQWITLIGACQFEDASGILYLRLIDIDGGRLDTAQPTFARSGVAAFWRAQVLSKEPLRLGPLEEIPLTEDFALELPLATLNQRASQIRIDTRDGAKFPNGSTSQAFAIESVRRLGAIRTVVQSSIRDVDFAITTSVLDEDNHLLEEQRHVFRKDMARSILPLDNKHGGRAPPKMVLPLSASADGTSQTLFLFPSSGGTPAVLWHGAPFSQPMGVQFSADGLSLYVTDQNAGPDGKSVLFKVNLPQSAEIASMFPYALK